jgi:putative transposase
VGRGRRGSPGPFEDLEKIRKDAAMPVSRFSALIGIPRRTYFRRLAVLRSGQSHERRRRRGGSVEACLPILAQYVSEWPGYGYRRLHMLMLADGHITSASTVFRALRTLRGSRAEAADQAGGAGGD